MLVALLLSLNEFCVFLCDPISQVERRGNNSVTLSLISYVGLSQVLLELKTDAYKFGAGMEPCRQVPFLYKSL
jgi:hypothetical protein